MAQKYNIIGDIHGSDIWKRLVQDDAINIFVGDYLDTKVELHDLPDPTSSKQKRPCLRSITTANITNFLEIIRYKQEHPDTVLLMGNHDLHYLIDERYSSFAEHLAPLHYQLLQTFAPLFHGVAYSINNEVLVSHAGVTDKWWDMFFPTDTNHSPDHIAALLNKQVFCKNGDVRTWDTRALFNLFSAERTFEPNDPCGESPTASPLWVRPEALAEHNIFGTNEQLFQVVGHTPQEEIGTYGGIIFIDNLWSGKQFSLTIQTGCPGRDTPHFDINPPRDK